ncbi:uncharacterized protein LOC119734068 [Patiria miniata]|uniref:Uncharacterized protein n=1 Tax=Patiria miniata TaxID=46514 RepID=A0A914AIJ0_PATMI|nr:uncharacterized protein LOC119734068 [Patiria miniata]
MRFAEIDVTLKVEDLVLFQYKVLDIICEGQHEEQHPTKSAFTVMMQAQKDCSHLPSKKSAAKMTSVDRLHNACIDMLSEQGVGWTKADASERGTKFVKTLVDTLWYIDFHHGQFAERNCPIPNMFQKFHGYCDPKVLHRPAPKIKYAELKLHIDTWCNILLQPYLSENRWQFVSQSLSSLVESMQKYLVFLSKQVERNDAHHVAEQPVRSPDNEFTFQITEASRHVPVQYRDLQTALSGVDEYVPMSLIRFEPEDRYERRKWVLQLALDVPFAMWTYYQGNYLGNLTYIWRVPFKKEQRIQERDMDLIGQIKLHIPRYSTRAMRKEFIDRYMQSAKVKPAILRDMFRFIKEDASASETSNQTAIDQRVLRFIADSDEPDLFYDLRSMNGNASSTKFDVFWEELSKFLDEVCVVDDRRHDTQLYMPFAVSVADLRRQIMERLPADANIPSTSWMRFQFWPSNPHSNAAVRYTGRFNVKYAVQQRLLRQEHPDSKYAGFNFKLLKEFAVKWKDHAVFLCLDDKAVVPVGEPHAPVSTGVRAHGKSLTSADPERATKALDHDFHVCGLVPSVTFHADIPEGPRDSFYNGDVYVRIKNKIFEPSTAQRHACEVIDLLRERHCEDGVNLDKSILINFTDGGPDHRTTNPSVQIAAIALFIALDLDMFIHARTAPHGSYLNPAERIMSLLNLALQNVSLARNEMAADYEKIMKRCNGLKSTRKEAHDLPSFKTALLESTSEVVEVLQKRFGRLQFKEAQVNVKKALSDEQINTIALEEMLGVVSQNARLNWSRKEMEKDLMFSRFFQKHCRRSQYAFQVKKCKLEEVDSCAYCYLNPPRMSDDLYGDLKWSPDPVLAPDNEHFLPFSVVYGTPQLSPDVDMPSRQGRVDVTENDKSNKSLLTREKARMHVSCRECGKRRLVYSAKKPSSRERDAIIDMEDELSYQCGNSLFPPGHEKHSVHVSRESITCSSQIETAYYTVVGQYFGTICVYCGETDVDEDDHRLTEAAQKFASVRPMCQSCLDIGKPLVTRGKVK